MEGSLILLCPSPQPTRRPASPMELWQKIGPGSVGGSGGCSTLLPQLLVALPRPAARVESRRLLPSRRE